MNQTTTQEIKVIDEVISFLDFFKDLENNRGARAITSLARGRY